MSQGESHDYLKPAADMKAATPSMVPKSGVSKMTQAPKQDIRTMSEMRSSPFLSSGAGRVSGLGYSGQVARCTARPVNCGCSSMGLRFLLCRAVRGYAGRGALPQTRGRRNRQRRERQSGLLGDESIRKGSVVWRAYPRPRDLRREVCSRLETGSPLRHGVP